CSCPSSPIGTIRCVECHGSRLRCPACIVADHCFTPLHRLEKWKKGRFVPVSLTDLGLVHYLGHGGQSCPFADQSPTPHHKMIVAHVNGFHTISLGYCQCPTAPERFVQLLRACLFPSTLVQPKSAYTLQLLHHFRTLNLSTSITSYGYIKSLARTTDFLFPEESKLRYDGFQIVVRVWRELQLRLSSGFALGLESLLPAPYNESMAYLCPACPNPGINFDPDAVFDEDMIHTHTLYLCKDANFRQWQLQKQLNPLDFHLHPGHMYFREELKYQEYIAAAKDDTAVCDIFVVSVTILTVLSIQVSTCSGFKAGNIYRSSKFKNAAVTGILSCMCARHGSFRPDATVDLQKGEKFLNGDYAFAGAVEFAGAVPCIVH
ncbi:hypothetical protein BOTBODRAFT_92472, partial [Botryobasidium botryosum FD-172 SS1]